MASITLDSTAPTPATNRLSLESIPTVDLRLLSQSELAALSMCSPHAFDLRRCDDVVIPKIDRSVFNESAGSRKQTYSRLRLAPRNANLSSSKPRTPALETLDSERADNSRIIALFKHLFNSSASDSLVPVNVEYSDALSAGPSIVAVSIPVYSGEERKKKRGRKPKSETLAPLALGLVEEGDMDGVKEDGQGMEELEKEVVNKNGMVVDLGELAKLEDPYGPELRHRTEGMERPEELLGFMTGLQGQWGSRRKKRKIIDANEFGDALPNGWKVLIGMKKKQGRAWLFCRRYISPTGRYFMSCKEVSSYLLSLISPPVSWQKISVQCNEDPMVDNKSTSENVVDDETKIDPPLYLTSQSDDYESLQTQSYVSQPIDHEKQVIFSNNVQPEEAQVSSALKCHKCSSPFNEKDGLLNHLLSCHKRKRRKAGAPVEDDVMMKDGKYECQFCNRMFHERNIYFGHVGMHVKNYVKSIGGSPGVAAKQKTCDPALIGGVAVTVSDALGLVEGNADSESPNILASGEPNLCFVDSKLKIGSDAETHTENCINGQGNLAVHPEMNGKTARDKASIDESCDKQDEIVHTGHNEVVKVDEPIDVPAVKPGFCAGSNENNDSCGNSGQINATECAVSEISSPSSVAVENAETCLLPDSNQVNLGNNGNFDSDGDLYYEGVVSEIGLPANNGENTTNLDSQDSFLGNDAVDNRKYGGGVKDGDNDGLMVGFGKGHLDLDMVMEDDVQHTGSMKDSSVCSVVSHKEEETCGITDNKIGYTGSKLIDSELKRVSETSSTPSQDQIAVGTQNYVGDVFMGLMNETEVNLCSLGKADVKVDGVSSIAQEGQTEDNSSYTRNNSKKVPAVTMLEPQGTGDFQVEETCNLENSPGEVSNRVGQGPKRDPVNSSNLFFSSRSTDMALDANVMTDNGQRNISSACSPIHSGNDKAHSDISTVLSPYNKFLENKQEQDPKNILSGISCNEHMQEVTIDNITAVCAGTATRQPLELDKVDNSQTNKLILDFSNITDINERFLNTVQQAIPEGSSPFSLWTEPACVENDRTSDYGIAKGVDKQERDSENSSLNFVGLQQPCDGGYNLNKVCGNEQRYDLQHTETGYYNRSSETGREGIPRGHTLNLAGFQQQCDAGYNLNKPCEQNFGVQHDEPRAYSTSDETGQERITYGHSLSLASVQQTCDTGYSLNKACVQQTCETGYTLNKGYVGPLQGLSRLGGLEHSRDRDLMIGFGNSSTRPNQGIGTEFLWRATEGNILHGSSVDSSSTQAQSSGFFRAFDFLSDKSGNDLCTGNEKLENISRFEGLRSTSVEPMEFSFLTAQDSNAQMEDTKVLSYNTDMDQGFGSSVWHQKATSLPNMMGGHVVSTLCVWCGNEFHQDSLGCEMQVGSIGYLCPTCKARMSGQFL